MMEGVESLGRRGSRCQSSSVTNGMNGCNRRKPWSRHVYSVCCADFLEVRGADSSVMGFIASYNMTVSQNMFVSRNMISYNINITELIQPEVIRRGGRKHEIPISEMSIDLSRGRIQLV